LVEQLPTPTIVKILIIEIVEVVVTMITTTSAAVTFIQIDVIQVRRENGT